MKSEILSYIKNNGDATFFSMERDIAGFSGEYKLTLGDNENLIVWPTISLEASNAIKDLIKLKKVRPEVVESIVYAFDGGSVPKMPIARRPARIKKPHWLPMVLHFVSE